MRNARIIALHNPRTRKVRDLFRRIIISRVYDILNNLEHELYLLSVEDSAGIKENHAKQAQLIVPLRKSILICPVCHSQDKDMYYNAYTKEWVCVECVDLIREEFKEKAALYEQGQHYGDYDFMYFGTFLK